MIRYKLLLMRIIEWIKNNKLLTFFIVLFSFLAFRYVTTNILGVGQYRYTGSGVGYSQQGIGGAVTDSYSLGAKSGVSLPSIALNKTRTSPSFSNESVDLSQTDRMVVEETNLSLQVEDVSDSIQLIKNKAQTLGGFMVNANLSRPQESSSGYISIRVPSSKSEEMLNYLRENSVQVVSENLNGYDVTDAYSDIDAKLQTLLSTKAKFEAFMLKAETIDEILRVQSELLRLQDQIDAQVGQKKYLEDVSSSVKITVYLSTDEYSLPYAPDDNWRPEVVFKTAVRSLVISLRGLAENLIWLAVYAVIWIPILIIGIVIYKFVKKKKIENKQPQEPSLT